MKLWLLTPRADLGDNDPWEPWYDKVFGFLVRAETEAHARRIANEHGGDETGPIETDIYRTGGDPWLSPTLSDCLELVSAQGDAGVVLRDFRKA